MRWVALWKQIALVFVSAVILSFLTASLFSDGKSAATVGWDVAVEEAVADEVVPLTGEGLRQRRLDDALFKERVVAGPVTVTDPDPDMLGFVKRPYTLGESARGAPFHVLEMWHDGRFIYLRTDARTRPALYQPSDTDDRDLLPLGMYPATEGLYVVDGVAREGGWMQIGNAWARWHLETREDGQ